MSSGEKSVEVPEVYLVEIAKGLDLPLNQQRPDPSKAARNIFERRRVSTVNTKKISARDE